MANVSKKLINNVDTCVDECLAGLAASHPKLVLHPQQRVLFDGTPDAQRKVAVISGAGAGHEPFSIGYVGPGMLTAAVSGSVFASPPSSHVLHAIRQAASVSSDGVFVVIPNYTGDILNFGLAVQLAKSEGIRVESIVFGEDVSLEAHGIVSRAGRRGMCGIIVAYKILGSLARAGAPLSEIRQTAADVLSNVASVSLGLRACTLPGASAPLFQLAADEMVLGIGAHGEAGVQRLKLLPAKEAVAHLLGPLRSYFKLTPGDEVVILANNLGGLSHLEQWLVAGEIQAQLREQGIIVRRSYACPFLTSLDMVGVLVTCLRLPPNSKDSWLAALDDHTDAPAWPGCVSSIPTSQQLNFAASCESERSVSDISPRGPSATPDVSNFIHSCLDNVTLALTRVEERLNVLDSGCGDGDCGTTLRHLADGIRNEIRKGSLNTEYPATLASQLAAIAATTMGGTSGAIYSLFLTYGGNQLEKNVNFSDPRTWAEVWRAALSGVQKYSLARVGDRTMFDALEPACEAFERCLDDASDSKTAFERSVRIATEGCEKTRTMLAKAGRASYVDASQLKDVDAGAYAVTIWLEAILSTFS